MKVDISGFPGILLKCYFKPLRVKMTSSWSLRFPIFLFSILYFLFSLSWIFYFYLLSPWPFLFFPIFFLSLSFSLLLFYTQVIDLVKLFNNNHPAIKVSSSVEDAMKNWIVNNFSSNLRTTGNTLKYYKAWTKPGAPAKVM